MAIDSPQQLQRAASEGLSVEVEADALFKALRIVTTAHLVLDAYNKEPLHPSMEGTALDNSLRELSRDVRWLHMENEDDE